MIKNYDEIIERVKNNRKTMAVVEAGDSHTLQAVIMAYEKGLITPLLIGDASKIKEHLKDYDHQFQIIDSIDPEESAKIGVALTNDGSCDFLMKGFIDTKVLLKAILNDNPLKEKTHLTHIAALSMPSYHKLLFLTDGGIIPYPSLEDKEYILRNVLELLRSIDYERPKVAMLSVVEKYNPKMKEVVDGVALKEKALKGEFGECVVEAPISFDLIYQKEAAEIKGYKSEVAGDADVILAPDMCLGNTLAKSLSIVGGGIFSGLVYGALYPVVLTSRSMSSEEKFYSIALSSLVRRRL